MRRLPCIVGLLVLGHFSSLPTFAQEVSITVPAITVIDEPNRHYNVGDVLQLNSHAPDVHRVGGSQHLHVRILRGSRTELQTRRYRSADGCVLYPSSLFRAAETDGGIKIQTVDKRDGSLVDVVLTENWLSSSVGRALHDQPYLLVFEIAEHEEDILKLRDEDVAPYFNIGFTFVVRAPQRQLDEVKVQAIMLAESSARAEAADRISALASIRGTTGVSAIDIPIEPTSKAAQAGKGGSALDHEAASTAAVETEDGGSEASVGKTHGKRFKRQKSPPQKVKSPACTAYFKLKFDRVAHLVEIPCSCDPAEVGYGALALTTTRSRGSTEHQPQEAPGPSRE